MEAEQSTPAMNAASYHTSDQPTVERDVTKAIGTILVEAGRLNFAQVEEIQAVAASSGLRFGAAAVQLRLLTHEDVEFALSKQFNYPILSHGAECDVSQDVVAAHSPHSALAEKLRTIRSRLTLGWLHRTNRNILAVVSPGRREGRSWMAANLATVFAQTSLRTLLIDADMRHPRQHELFNVKEDMGLSAVLTGRAGWEAIRQVHPHLSLSVMTAGIAPPNPQELIALDFFASILDGLKAQFDLIVIDTPCASESADAELLASHAGSAVVVARRNRTRQAQLTQTTKRLMQSGVTIAGTMLSEF